MITTHEAHLQTGWISLQLEECGELYCGQSPSVAEVNTGGKGAPYFTGPEQWDGHKLHLNKWTLHPKRLVPDGCIFITVKGAGVGKMFPGIAGAIGRDIYAFRVHEELDFNYVFYALKFTIDQIIRQAQGDIPGLSKAHILDHEIGLPGIDQQRRIVAKIEALFSEVDDGVENLEKAREQLNVYRQVLLRDAFEGKLTADWRADNKDKIETTVQLLARISREREGRYEQEVRAWKTEVKASEANGQPARKPSKPRRPERFNLEEKELSDLPNGWAWECIGNLDVDVFDGPFGSNLKTSDYVDEGVRVIRLENIGFMKFIEGKRSYVTQEKYAAISKHTVCAGDIIFSSFVTDGIRATILPSSIKEAVNKADCFCVRLYGDAVRNNFLLHFLSTRAAYKQIEAEIHGIGRPRINTTQLKCLAVPLCGVEEQAEIMQRLSEKLSLIENAELLIGQEMQKIEGLRQAILKKAFSGELVAQDPNDQPASVLLERIRADEEVADANARTRRKDAA